jgi:hemoglobin/transferrin/lactoferrin receptor protein
MLASPDYSWQYTKTKNIPGMRLCGLVVLATLLILAQPVSAAEDAAPDAAENKAANTLAPAVGEKTQTSTGKQAEADKVETLPEVSVKDKRVIEDSGIHRTLPITTITSDQLQRSQPSNIFDAVRSAPGVSINGGPRPSGMSFNIRGYEDNEDVLVKVDGVPKGFEKYRMGGTFVEPELLKSIEIQRGPQIASGSGSLGGTVIANTKDAEDFLKPGQKFGAKAKFGYGNNSDEYSRSYILYARPDERVDILYNYSNRSANNITLGDGSKLAQSAIESVSHLLKFSLFPTEDLQLVTSVVKFEDSGLQQYDANSSGPGFFGYVIRSVDDLTWSETLKYNPNRWVKLKAIVGAGHSDVIDLIPPGFLGVQFTPNQADPAGCNGIVFTPDPSQTAACKGNMTDTYKFKTKTVDISNETIFAENGFFNASLLTGYQYNFSHRDVTRVWDNPFLPVDPSGFFPAVPPGTKTFHAIYIQPRFEIGQVSVIPGYRQDRYKVEADGGTLALLRPFGQEDKIEFKEETWSLGLAYDLFEKKDPEKLTLYTNYGQGFRPPLIDEYFAQGGFGRCQSSQDSMPTVAPPSRICGDLYKPQLSEATEAGVSYQTPHFLGTDAFFSGKVNYFHIYTSRLLASLGERDGQVMQDGTERRNGVEIESFMQYKNWFARAGYSRITGEIVTGRRSLTRYPLFTAPGNTLNLNVGVELTKDIDINLTYRKVSDREVIVSGTGTITSPYRFGPQDSYELWNVGARWKASEQLTFRLIGENLKNEFYNLNGSFGGLGLPAPGRNVKFLVEMTY